MSEISSQIKDVLDSEYDIDDPKKATIYFYGANETWQGIGETITSDGWSAYEIDAILKALDVYSKYIDISFSVTDTPIGATFKVGTGNIDGGSAAGYFYLPDHGRLAGVGMFDNTLDSWSNASLQEGGKSFNLILHELGHGFGLEHPHGGHEGRTFPGVSYGRSDDFGDYQLNQGVYTVMGYNQGYSAHSLQPGRAPGVTQSWEFGYAATPMAFDIAVLQDKYSINATYALEDNTYYLPYENISGTGYSAIWDMGGIDTITASNGVSSVIDLRPATLQVEEGGGGWVSASHGIYGGFTIASGVIIENATGANMDDKVTGNRAHNTLVGRGGNDILQDAMGNDFLSGGSGDDVLLEGTGANTLDGGAGSDLLIGGVQSDKIFGGAGRDILRGDPAKSFIGGADALEGGTGDDFLMGGHGADVFIFAPGDGADTISKFNISVNNPVSLYPLIPVGMDFISGYDVIKLVGFGADVQDNPMDFVERDGSSTVFDAENTKITFFGVTGLVADDFIFG